MPISSEQKLKAISRVAYHEKDTGSSAVQISILTDEINHLTEHMKAHPKDKHSLRGLIGKVEQRRRNLKFLSRDKPSLCKKIIDDLGIRYKFDERY